MRKALNFSAQFRETFGEIRRDPEHIYQQISKGTLISRELNIGPLFFDKWACSIAYPEKGDCLDYETNHNKVNVLCFDS